MSTYHKMNWWLWRLLAAHGNRPLQDRGTHSPSAVGTLGATASQLCPALATGFSQSKLPCSKLRRLPRGHHIQRFPSAGVQSMVGLPHLRTTPRGHPSFLPSPAISWGLFWDCITSSAFTSTQVWFPETTNSPSTSQANVSLWASFPDHKN